VPWTVLVKNRNTSAGLTEADSAQLQTGQQQEEIKICIFPFLPAENPILAVHCFRRQAMLHAADERNTHSRVDSNIA